MEEGSAAVLLAGVVSAHRAGGALFEAEGGGGGGAQEVEVAEAGFGGVDGGARQGGPDGAVGGGGWAAEADGGVRGQWSGLGSQWSVVRSQSVGVGRSGGWSLGLGYLSVFGWGWG